MYIKDQEGLLALVQMGMLEIHPWGSRIQHPQTPDWMIFDLDPGPGVTWKAIVSAALEVKSLLAQFHLESFVKTTGGHGLHVYIPLQAKQRWISIKTFSHRFALLLERQSSEKYVTVMSKQKREGKIFIDYLRNQVGATAIAPYGLRARSHAPISVPLAWDELSKDIQDNFYTLNTLSQRLKTLKEDPWADFFKVKQTLPKGDG